MRRLGDRSRIRRMEERHSQCRHYNFKWNREIQFHAKWKELGRRAWFTRYGRERGSPRGGGAARRSARSCQRQQLAKRAERIARQVQDGVEWNISGIVGSASVDPADECRVPVAPDFAWRR